MEKYEDILMHLIPVVLSGVAGLILGLIILWVTKRIAKDDTWVTDDDLDKLKTPLITILVLFGLFISTHIEFPDRIPYVEQGFQILFIISFSWLLIRAVAIGRLILLKQYDISVEDNLKARKAYTQIRVFERISNVIIIIIAVSLVLMTFDSIRTFGASLLTSAGIAGIIIGVAAQKLLANLLAGFQIAVTQPIRIDDVVIMEGEWGWIEEITLTYVVVRIWDHRRLIVPSSQVIEKPFQNWTRTSSDILGTVFIYTDYRMPVDPLREELTRVLEQSPHWDKKVNVLQVTNLTDRSMEIRALMSSKDSPKAWDLRVEVREKLIGFMQKNYPQYLPVTRVEMKKEDGVAEGRKQKA